MTAPLVAQARSSTTWYTGLGPVEDAAQISAGIRDRSWVDGTLGTVGGSLDTLGTVVDPLGSLASWGVSWLMEHVRPLSEALDQLAGNPDEVAAHAATWDNVGRATAEARDGYAARLRAETEGWAGISGDAYRTHAGDQLAVMQGVSTAAHGISSAVQGSGLLVGLVRGIVRDLIAQFVGTLAARLPQWLAEEGLTLGVATPVVIGQVAALVAQWVSRIHRFLRALLNSLRQLRPMVQRLGDVLAELNQVLRKLTRSDPLEPSTATPGDHVPGPRTDPDPVDPPGSRTPDDGGPSVAGWHEGDPIPPPRDGGGLPTDAHLGERFVGEDDPDNPYRAFHPDTVTYFSAEEREQHRVFVDGDGFLRSARDGSLFDTEGGATHWSGSGRAIFVADAHGNLYASHEQVVGRIHHSSLMAGAPVAGAGEIEVRQGRLVLMTDQSGHYQPSAATNDRLLQNLRDQGLRTDPDFKRNGWNGSER